MKNNVLVQRLTSTHPGWDVWDQLISLVESLDFDFISNEYLGEYYTSGARLTFAVPSEQIAFPDWLPAYVPALYGMKADEWEMAGGYAQGFHGKPAAKGHAFSPAGNDQELGFPLIEIPEGVYDFQSNSSGAVFFINTRLQVLYPNAEEKRFEILDGFDEFTRKNIRQALAGQLWFGAYSGLTGTLLD